MSKNSVFASSGFPTRFHLVLPSLLVTPSSSWCRLPNFLGNQSTYSWFFWGFFFLSACIIVDDVGLAPGKWQCYVSFKCWRNMKENANILRQLCFLGNLMAMAKMGMTGMDMSQCSWLRNKVSNYDFWGMSKNVISKPHFLCNCLFSLWIKAVYCGSFFWLLPTATSQTTTFIICNIFMLQH